VELVFESIDSCEAFADFPNDAHTLTRERLSKIEAKNFALTSCLISSLIATVGCVSDGSRSMGNGLECASVVTQEFSRDGAGDLVFDVKVKNTSNREIRIVGLKSD